MLADDIVGKTYILPCIIRDVILNAGVSDLERLLGGIISSYMLRIFFVLHFFFSFSNFTTTTRITAICCSVWVVDLEIELVLEFALHLLLTLVEEVMHREELVGIRL